MKYLIRFIFCLSFFAGLAGECFSQNIRAVWMYDFDTWKNDPNFGNRIFNVSALKFNQIYLGVLSDQLTVPAYRDKMIAFVTQAKSQGLTVHATTLQNPHFTFDTPAYPQHGEALNRVQAILNYNIANASAAFAGIHIDVEPHILTEANHTGHDHDFWTLISEGPDPVLTETTKTRRAGIMAQFKTLLQRIRNEKINPHNNAHPDVAFSSTVGWWYNEKSNGMPNGYLPSGATELTAYLDYIVPMVYSGGVGETAADIISRVDDEIQTAQAPTIVGISVESLMNFTGGVKTVIDDLETEFGSDPAFLGTSVFKYADLQDPLPVEYKVSSITNTSGLGVTNFEPEPYSYNFIAPLRSELLCKNNHLGTTPVTNLSSTVPATTYEDEMGTITTNASIGTNDRVWLIAEESIVLTEGFQATADNFFVAEMKNELDFCTDPDDYTPNTFVNRFFTSIYGPRMTSSGGDITRPYDFHRGEDIVDKAFPGAFKPDIICICDGIVHEVFDENDLPPGSNIENAPPDEGRSVTVKCDSTFKGNNFGNIYTAYRHLSAIEPGLTEGVTIRKGDLIGKMGSSGSPSPTGGHLHFSVQKDVAGELINVHPMRVFNNAINHHLNLSIDDEPTGTEEEKKKKRVNLFLLDYQNGSAIVDENWAIFRVAVPYNKVAIRAILIRNGSYSQKADFEEISETRDGNNAWLDDPVVGDLKLFPLPFVRAGTPSYTPHGRYNDIKDDLCNMEVNDDDDVCDHPAIDYPIENEGIFSASAYVLDIKAKGLDQYFDPFDFEVDVLDVWGNGVRGTLSTPPPIPLVAAPHPPTTELTGLENTILENPSFSMQVFPNPTADDEAYVVINNPEKQEWELSVTNLSGQVLMPGWFHKAVCAIRWTFVR